HLPLHSFPTRRSSDLIIAIFEEKSPFALSLGVSILMSGISDTIPDFFTAFSSSSDNPAFKFIIDPRSLIYIGICLIIDLVQTIRSEEHTSELQSRFDL